jgi:hypothetical protein
MPEELEPAALAAVAAAYAIVLRARNAASPEPATPAWRVAARLSVGSETTIVTPPAARRSPWNASGGP